MGVISDSISFVSSISHSILRYVVWKSYAFDQKVVQIWINCSEIGGSKDIAAWLTCQLSLRRCTDASTLETTWWVGVRPRSILEKKLVLKRFTVTHSSLSNSEHWPRINMESTQLRSYAPTKAGNHMCRRLYIESKARYQEVCGNRSHSLQYNLLANWPIHKSIAFILHLYRSCTYTIKHENRLLAHIFVSPWVLYTFVHPWSTPCSLRILLGLIVAGYPSRMRVN